MVFLGNLEGNRFFFILFPVNRKYKIFLLALEILSDNNLGSKIGFYILQHCNNFVLPFLENLDFIKNDYNFTSINTSFVSSFELINHLTRKYHWLVTLNQTFNVSCRWNRWSGRNHLNFLNFTMNENWVGPAHTTIQTNIHKFNLVVFIACLFQIDKEFYHWNGIRTVLTTFHYNKYGKFEMCALEWGIHLVQETLVTNFILG